MPTRLLSQTINVSNSISKLTPIEEVVFIHLIVSVDDYGRFYGNPDILKGMLFPLRNFTPKQIEESLQKLEKEGMIRRYTANETQFLALTAWMKYQKPRAKTSKFPDPDDVKPGEQYETVMTNNANGTEVVVRTVKQEPEDDSPVLFRLPLNTGEEHNVTEKDVKEYAELYPAVDVEQEIRAMIGWLKADRKRLKTKSGIRRFIAGWLNRSQNSGSGAKKTVSANQIKDVIVYGDDNPFR